MYFEKYMKTVYPQNITPAKVLSMSFEDQVGVMQLLCSRMGLDGDMVGSASPLDPIFWVSHGALERLYHHISFHSGDGDGDGDNRLLTDLEYSTESDCSGHAPNGTKAWLEGYYLQDETVSVKEVTNVQLTALLNPYHEKFVDLIPYLYDASPMGCDEAEALLA
jgi:hypothetical protein